MGPKELLQSDLDQILHFLFLKQHEGELCVTEVKTAIYKLSPVVRKPAFCICENKDEDQLRGNREVDQRLCFRYIDSTIPLLPKDEISSF